MKKALLFIGILSILVSLPAYLIENASLEQFLIGTEEACEYDNWVSHIAEGIASNNYNLYAPFDRQTNGFGDFRVPTTEELSTWGQVVDYFLLGMLDEAQATIDNAGFPYQALVFNDSDTGRRYFMLREIPDMSFTDDNGTEDDYDDEHGAFTYGWGLYIYRPQSTRPIIVTAPHPTDDFFTTIIGYDCLRTWDASFLLINGSGREVRWTNSGAYTNSKSISDPTRTEAHPFNVAYQKFADRIRDQYGRREFSFQIHSYDWNRHVGYTDNQISAGNNKLCPNLPIRDLSSLKQDLINMGDHLMIPANTIGIHDDVFLNQYYSVNYSVHDFIFSDGENEYPVNDMIDLPAYSQNRQMIYTLNGWNDYDSFEPFMHIEMDELPNMYEETENVYKWFYGWIEDEGRWDMENLFTYPRQYYSRWINDLESLYDDMFAMNDGLTPPIPENLHVINNSMQYVTLGWARSDAYDFDSYEILYSTTPISEGNYQIYDRNNKTFLASQACESIDVSGLNSSYNYYFKIRARDKNGNLSDLSNEVMSTPAATSISGFKAYGMDTSIRLAWGTNPPTGFLGFNVYRKQEFTDYEMIDSYTSSPALVAGNYNFEYWDFDVVNGEHYEYRISSINSNGVETIHNVPQKASPAVVHSLILENQTGMLSDVATFSQNPYASDAQDTYWDVTKPGPTSNYVWLSFYEQYWSQSGVYLSQEVKGGYDTNQQLKTWIIRIRSDQLNVPLYLSLPTVLRSEKIYIYDNGTGNWHNMQDGAYQFTVSNSNPRTMTLYWGNMQPSINHNYMPNQVLQGGYNTQFSWSPQYPFLIDHVNLYLKNDIDSLMVAQNIPTGITNYSYTIPNAINMPKTKVCLEMVSVDGFSETFVSPHTLALVPSINTMDNVAGWATKSNPFLIQSFSMAEAFGNGSIGYVWNNQWQEVPSFDFGAGYLVHATEPTTISSDSAVLRLATEFELTTGWNLIANPHLCEYETSALSFSVNGTDYRFSEMISQQLISKAVYVYRDSSFVLTDNILPYEAFYLKNYANSANNVILKLNPYNYSVNVEPPAPSWSVTVRSNLTNKDYIEVGCNPIATSAYDFRLDLPKAPNPELFSTTAFYMDRTDNPAFSEEQYLRTEYRSNFTSIEETEMAFDFSLDADEAGELYFDVSTMVIPVDWTVRIHFMGSAPHVSDGSQVSFNIPEAGLYNGQLIVYNYPVSNEDVVKPVVSNLKAYPNPFNPSVNIAFNLPESRDCSVEIFNIRGQKVASLHRGILNSGDHQIRWHGKDSRNRSVSSGIYFARIKSKNYSKSIKMMLMK